MSDSAAPLRATEGRGAQNQRGGGRPQAGRETPCYAALDLGTNNCRLLIATPAGQGFRVVEAFSRIVRLGDGLAHTGRLDDNAIERAMGALHVCAERVRRRRAVRIKAVATQACRSAENGAAFVARVEAETGLKLKVISPREEAQLSVAGCAGLLDRSGEAALVVDVGGGSTELSWLDLRNLDQSDPSRPPPILAWLSIPVGVVTLADRFPETEAVDSESRGRWFEAMTEHVRSHLRGFPHAEPLRDVFQRGGGHLIGTSGAITSLAGLHLGLPRYERSKVDGLWMDRADCEKAAARLMLLDARGRAGEPCIGPDRADLVLAGAAILEAVQSLWPCPRVRVADRGLREGILLSLMSERRKRRRRGRRRSAQAAAAE
jgi:exopolyphosphatase/guanosine-5'-triphosphate,3'-diphosphate pyrophosphatase